MKQTQQQIENEWKNATIAFLASPEGRDFRCDEFNQEIMFRYLSAWELNSADKVKALKTAYKRLKTLGLLR